MKIGIDSNLILPGLQEKNEVYLDSPRVTLRMVLEELGARSSGRVKYIHPSTGAVDPMDFVIEINGLPNSGSKEDLEMGLSEGDMVTIKVSPLGGG
jgi:hypothetical protein